MRPTRLSLFLAFAFPLANGCSHLASVGASCAKSSDCAAGLFCVSDKCSASADASTTGGASAGSTNGGNTSGTLSITDVHGDTANAAATASEGFWTTSGILITGTGFDASGLTVKITDAAANAYTLIVSSANATSITAALPVAFPGSVFASSTTAAMTLTVVTASGSVSRDLSVLQGPPGTAGASASIALPYSGSVLHQASAFGSPSSADAAFTIINTAVQDGATSTPGGSGIWGETASAFNGSDSWSGVVGHSTAATGGVGVLGFTSSTDASGAGVFAGGNQEAPGLFAYNPGHPAVVVNGNSDLSNGGANAVSLPITIRRSPGVASAENIYCTSTGAFSGAGVTSTGVPIACNCLSAGSVESSFIIDHWGSDAAVGPTTGVAGVAPVLGGGCRCVTSSGNTQAQVVCLTSF